MKLRDHPLMTSRSGITAWPPLWVNMRDPSDRPKGELGTLKRVRGADTILNALFVWIEYKSAEYVGGLYFEDPAFSTGICRVLEANLGLSIAQIGDIDLSYTP